MFWPAVMKSEVWKDLALHRVADHGVLRAILNTSNKADIYIVQLYSVPTICEPRNRMF